MKDSEALTAENLIFLESKSLMSGFWFMKAEHKWRHVNNLLKHDAKLNPILVKRFSKFLIVSQK